MDQSAQGLVPHISDQRGPWLCSLPPRALRRASRPPGCPKGRVLPTSGARKWAHFSSPAQPDVGPCAALPANPRRVKGPLAALSACHSTTRGCVGLNIPLLDQSCKSSPNSRAPCVHPFQSHQSSCATWQARSQILSAWNFCQSSGFAQLIFKISPKII